MGPFFALALAKDAFLESCAEYYGEGYVAALDALTPSWIVMVLIVLALVGGDVYKRQAFNLALSL